MWAEFTLLIIIYLVSIFFITFGVYEYAKSQRRKGFIKSIEGVVLSDLNADLAVKVIYEKAYHYIQPTDSIRGALTKILNKTTNDLDHQKISRIISLIKVNSRISVIMGLPEEFKSSIYNIYNYCSFLEREAVYLAWRIKDITEKNNNRKLLMTIFSLTTAFVTLISALIKYFFLR